MPIVGVRYDERLIHDQVVTFWINTLHADRIVVLDPVVADDEMLKTTLRIAVPKGIHSSIIHVETFIQNYLSGKYNKQRLFIIVRNIKIVVQLLEQGIGIQELNLGNRSKKKEDDIRISSHFVLDSDDLQFLEKLHNQGVKIYSQLTPQDNTVFKLKIC